MTNIFVTEFVEFSETIRKNFIVYLEESNNTAFEPKTGVHGIIGAQTQKASAVKVGS